MIDRNEVNAKAAGGTELACAELERVVDPDLLAKFQIIPSRFRGLKEGLIPVYWIHDTEEDPEVQHLANGGWNKFRLIVFVSNWQMQRFIDRFQIPWSMCTVMENAINPFPALPPLDQEGPVRFIYHTTPHRGLNILYAAFDYASKKNPDIHLDVYSSFKIYGWEDRDAGYKKLFDSISSHGNMTNHGTVPNDEIRAALLKTHAFVYPSTWPETSCRALMEAMMAGCLCAHTNFGCLYETASGLNFVYQYDENPSRLARTTGDIILNVAASIKENSTDRSRASISTASHAKFSWDNRKKQWDKLLSDLSRDGA